MDFIYKKYDFPVAVDYGLYYAFESFFEFALVFRPGNQCTHIKRIQPFCLKVFRNIPVYNPLRNAFGNGGLSHTWFTDKYRIVLCTPAEDLKHPADFFVTAYDRIQLAL